MVNCSGIQCEVTCSTKNEKGDKIETEYFIKLNEKEHQKWKEEWIIGLTIFLQINLNE